MVVLPSSPVWYQTRGVDSSSDGILAFGSRNLVYTLNLKDKRPEICGILSGHTDKVTTCSFCPLVNQRQILRLASGAEDCSVKVWDVRQKLMLQEHTAHGTNKIITVHWSPVNPSLIVSGDEKGFLICWNLDDGSTNRFDPDGSSQVNLCCVTCSPHDENIVAVGYKSGAVSLIDIKRKGNVVRKLRAHTNEVHGIAWMPKRNEDIFCKDAEADNGTETMKKSLDQYQGVIVTGSKDKTLRLWSISKGKCMRSFRIPARVNKGRKVNEEVARLYTTVFWPPGSDDKFISSGYNGDVILWNIEPKAENLFEILASHRHDAGHQRIVFNICQGVDANSIVTTSMDRQILHWTIPDFKATTCNGPDWSLPTLGGFVYSIAVSPSDPSVVAVGAGDGMIRVWRTQSSRNAYDIVTLWQGIKEKVMSLSWHPQKEGILAYATEDGKVGVYDVLSLRPPIVAETYHLKPVYALSWGPKCVMKSSEGSKSSDSKALNIYSCGGDGIIFQHDFKNMSSDAINIDDIIEVNNSHGGLNPGKHSEVSWSTDGVLLAIGNENGQIQIFTSPFLCHIATIKCHSKVVNCVCWKPIKIKTDIAYEIATGSNNSTVFIFDLNKIFTDHKYKVGDVIDEPIVVTRALKSLVGHLSRITGLSYNTRNPTEIVSSSYDSTAQVWNIETEKPIYNFRGHHGRLMCVVWTSVIDDRNSKNTSGIIYTGADDYTVHAWYAEDQQHTEPVKALPDFGFGPKNKFQSKKKTRQKKSAQGLPVRRTAQNSSEIASSTSHMNNGADQHDPDLDNVLEKRKAELLAIIDSNAGSETDLRPSSGASSDHILNLASSTDPYLPMPTSSSNVDEKPTTTLLTAKQPREPAVGAKTGEDSGTKTKKRLKNMFPESVSMDNRKKLHQHEDCLRIVEWKMEQMNSSEEPLKFIPGDPKHINLGFYTNRRAAYRMMKNEEKKLQERDYTEGSINIKLWMGDIVGAISEAVSLGQLTDQLVALAPLAGQNFWRETAYKFAMQLINEEHYLHAVQYLLVCGKVREAVDVLLKGRHYREAVALARARFCEDDPIIKKTVRAWALKLKSGGSVELAAKCFASIGEFEEAASVLAQRATSGNSNVTDSDIASLWAAASIAKKSNNRNLASDYANRALSTVCIRTWNWKGNAEILTSYPNLDAYRFISFVHEVLAIRLVVNSDLTELESSIKSFQFSDDRVLADSTFPEFVLREWEKQAELEHVEKLSDGPNETLCYDVLQESHGHNGMPVTDTSLLFELSISFSAAFCVSCLRTRKVGPPHYSTNRLENQDDYSTEKSCIEHLIRPVIMLLKYPACEKKLRDEVIKVICEMVKWTISQGGTNVAADFQSENGEKHDCNRDIDIMNILLKKAEERGNHVQSFLKAILSNS